MTSTRPDSAAVVRAAACIKNRVHRTPVLTSTHIDRLADARLYFKCENLQRVGAFKIRGATFALANLTAEQARSGVATHSSGNHGAALALAARERGMPAYVVMPETAPAVKFAAVAGYGAEIIRCGPSLASREAALAAVLAKTGATFIAPYNHADIIAGQGTAALELCADVADLDCLLAP
ncbi:MAG TPA: pyridoxal-phosphate dependent enzyme, partial [Salinisphaeraceae bacterium]|nr:pyridoxal-phosphate dependent enzyme [Salinisphaeraceae bacterium]